MKPTKAKKCKVCDKLLAANNQSMLCNSHYQEKLRLEKKYIQRREKENDN